MQTLELFLLSFLMLENYALLCSTKTEAFPSSLGIKYHLVLDTSVTENVCLKVPLKSTVDKKLKSKNVLSINKLIGTQLWKNLQIDQNSTLCHPSFLLLCYWHREDILIVYLNKGAVAKNCH